MANLELLTGGTGGKGAGPPLGQHRIELRRRRFGLAAKLDASRFGCGDSFLLPLADELAFCLRHIGEKLQNDVRNQRPGQIPVLSGKAPKKKKRKER